jgi:hypothetical protein
VPVCLAFQESHFIVELDDLDLIKTQTVVLSPEIDNCGSMTQATGCVLFGALVEFVDACLLAHVCCVTCVFVYHPCGNLVVARLNFCAML